jgi:hypothetical protein
MGRPAHVVGTPVSDTLKDAVSPGRKEEIVVGFIQVKLARMALEAPQRAISCAPSPYSTTLSAPVSSSLPGATLATTEHSNTNLMLQKDVALKFGWASSTTKLENTSYYSSTSSSGLRFVKYILYPDLVYEKLFINIKSHRGRELRF